MKTILLSGAVMLLSVMTYAQETISSTADWDPKVYEVGKKYPGYVITLDGDSIQGFLKAKTRCSNGGLGASNQNEAEFYAHEEDKKPTAKYKPGEIKGYKIADKVYESINYSGGLLKKPNFNLVVTDGAIRVYEWYATKDNYNTVVKQSGESWKAFDARRFDTKIIIAKDPTAPMEHSSLGLSFAKKMPELIADNPDMAQKVTNKESGYKFLNMFAVIDEYNKWAASQK
ncbi:hypothetical protein [Fluviicola sp.]|uniref:hypothetical protein n=1 Tax=Fluviicola sp. TaxID=1917219 RepID=UPI0031E00468